MAQAARARETELRALSDMEELANLSSAQLGSEIVFATDEWFAAADNMLQDGPAVWKADVYSDYGKWMDGWECRRRRTEGHDWCLVKLGVPASRVLFIEVDTAFFTGNFSPQVSVQGCFFEDESKALLDLGALRKSIAAGRPDGRMGLAASPEEAALAASLGTDSWPMIVPLTPLGAGYEETRRTIFRIDDSAGYGGRKMSHLRINMGPDGGIARLRVYGEVYVHPSRIPRDADIDLAAVEVGGRAMGCSDAHYGHPRNLIAPGRGTCMGDGWETARQPKRPPVYKRGADGLMVLPGCDWAILKLGLLGAVSSIEVDTNFYKGNYPESCLIEGCYLPDATAEELQSLAPQSGGEWKVLPSPNPNRGEWKVLLARTRLGPSSLHRFVPEAAGGGVLSVGVLSHVRLTIYPDGGVMRLRLYGRGKAGELSRL